jgi:hypothetical protein
MNIIEVIIADQEDVISKMLKQLKLTLAEILYFINKSCDVIISHFETTGHPMVPFKIHQNSEFYSSMVR